MPRSHPMDSDLIGEAWASVYFLKAPYTILLQNQNGEGSIGLNLQVNLYQSATCINVLVILR